MSAKDEAVRALHDAGCCTWHPSEPFGWNGEVCARRKCTGAEWLRAAYSAGAAAKLAEVVAWMKRQKFTAGLTEYDNKQKRKARDMLVAALESGALGGSDE